MTAVVGAEPLTKHFGEVSAVADLSFALEAGTIGGFLGPNGAGKTTMLRMILVLQHHCVDGPHSSARNSSAVMPTLARMPRKVPLGISRPA